MPRDLFKTTMAPLQLPASATPAQAESYFKVRVKTYWKSQSTVQKASRALRIIWSCWAEDCTRPGYLTNLLMGPGDKTPSVQVLEIVATISQNKRNAKNAVIRYMKRTLEAKKSGYNKLVPTDCDRVWEEIRADPKVYAVLGNHPLQQKELRNVTEQEDEDNEGTVMVEDANHVPPPSRGSPTIPPGVVTSNAGHQDQQNRGFLNSETLVASSNIHQTVEGRSSGTSEPGFLDLGGHGMATPAWQPSVNRGQTVPAPYDFEPGEGSDILSTEKFAQFPSDRDETASIRRGFSGRTRMPYPRQESQLQLTMEPAQAAGLARAALEVCGPSNQGQSGHESICIKQYENQTPVSAFNTTDAGYTPGPVDAFNDRDRIPAPSIEFTHRAEIEVHLTILTHFLDEVAFKPNADLPILTQLFAYVDHVYGGTGRKIDVLRLSVKKFDGSDGVVLNVGRGIVMEGELRRFFIQSLCLAQENPQPGHPKQVKILVKPAEFTFTFH